MERVKIAATLLMSMSMALTLFTAPVTVSAHEQEAEAGTEVTELPERLCVRIAAVR